MKAPTTRPMKASTERPTKVSSRGSLVSVFICSVCRPSSSLSSLLLLLLLLLCVFIGPLASRDLAGYGEDFFGYPNSPIPYANTCPGMRPIEMRKPNIEKKEWRNPIEQQ